MELWFLRTMLAALALMLSFCVVRAGEDEACFKCKLHGECPLPDFVALSRCLAARTPAPLAARANALVEPPGWVETPCGRIRASAARAPDRP